MNEKAKKELNTEDLKVLSGILSKSNEVLTKEEKAHLTARRAYLTEEELKAFKITEEEDTNDDKGNEGNDDGDGDEEEAPDYSGLKKEELEKECKKRDIEVPAKATVADMIELLEADDRGELEDDEDEK